MAQKQYLANLLVDGTLTVNTVANASVDTDKFLVLDGTTVKYRTGAQLLSDIGPITVPLSSLTAATGTNTIANGSFGQVWNWTNVANNGSALTLTSTSSQLTGYTLYVEITGSNSNPGGGINAAIYGYGKGTNAASSIIGIYGRADANGSDSSYGVYGLGGQVGVYGSGTASGVTGFASGAGLTSGGNGVYGAFSPFSGSFTGTPRGVYGTATVNGSATATTLIGVEGNAQKATTNYGGYFTALTSTNATKNVGAYFSASSAATTNYAIETGLGSVLIGNLAGAGTRMVVADANGLLSTQALPTGDPLTDGDKGDITVSSSGTVWTIDNNVVSLGKIQQIATASFLGRVTAATGNVEVLTGTQATTLLDTFTSVLKGLVPASGGGITNFLRADGTWATPPGSTSNARTVESFTATASQTTFTVTGGYTVGQIDVYYNGSRLNSTEYTASNGSTVVLGTGAPAGTILDIVTYQALSGSYDLNALTDVVISSPVTNQVLQYNGSSWVNATISTGSGYTVTSQTTNYNETATTGIKIIKGDTTGGAFTVNLPTAVGNTAVIHIKKVAGAADLNIEGFGSETIDGGLNAVIRRVGDSIMLVSDNTNWIII